MAESATSLSSITEVDLDQHQPSDFTIHFKDHAYHCHSQILIHATKYFADLAKPEEPCDVTAKCGEADHQCLTLPNLIGGTDVTTSEMTQLFELLYDPGRLTSSVTRHICLHEQTFVIKNGEGRHATWDGYKNASVKGNDALAEFLTVHHMTVQLASYFQCNRLLSSVESYLKILVNDAHLMKHFDSLWGLMNMADRYQLKMTTQLVDIVSKDTDAKSRPVFKRAMKDIRARRSFDTLAMLLECIL